MLSKIKMIHEEGYSNDTITLGILYNYTEDNLWKDTYPYIFKKEMYIFFNTMTDMFGYLAYGEGKMKRAYMEEHEFDKIFDLEYIDGEFSSKLIWV